MANTKISELSVATTPSGSESIPVVQGGVTKKTTLADLPVSAPQATAISGAQSAATSAAQSYTDAKLQGLQAKQPVDVATTANITLSGTQTIDGVAVTVGMRVLVKNQTTASQNGIYVVASGAWTRATDMDSAAEFPSAYIPVNQGTVNADTQWKCTNDTVVVGTTAIVIVAVSVSGVELTANKNAANGYAGLDANSRVAKANSYALSALTPVNAALSSGDDPQVVAEKLQGQITANLALAGIPLQAETVAYVAKLTAKANTYVSGSVINAIDEYFISGKANGWLATRKWVSCPVLSNTLVGALVNLVKGNALVPDELANFNLVSADHSQILGFGPGATNTNKYCDAGFKPSDLGLSLQNISLTIFSSDSTSETNNATNGYGVLGLDTPARSPLIIGLRGQASAAGMMLVTGLTAGRTDNTFAPAVFGISISGANSYIVTRNGVTDINATNGSTMSTEAIDGNVNLFRSLFSTGTYRFGKGRYAYLSIGTPMTATQQESYQKAIAKLLKVVGAQTATGGVELEDGDSLTIGVGASTGYKRAASLIAAELGLQELNVSQGGAQLRQTTTVAGTLNGLVGGLDRDASMLNLDFNSVRFAWGTNDAGTGDGTTTGDNTIIADFRTKYNAKVLKYLQLNKKTRIISPPYTSTINQTKLLKYVEASADVALNNNVPFVDAYNLILDTPTPSSFFDTDNIHLNDAGYRLLFELERTVLLAKRTYRNLVVNFSASAIAGGASADLTFVIYNVTDKMPVSITPSAPIAGINLQGFVSTAAVVGTPASIVTVRATNTTVSPIIIPSQYMRIEVILDK